MKSLKLVLFTISFCLVICGCFSFAGNPFVWNLLGTQLEIGLNQRSNMGSLRNGSGGNALSLQDDVKYWNQYDLISELDNASTEQERLKIIDNYTASLSNVVADGSTLYNYEKSQVDYYNNLSKECEAPIKGKNSEFSAAVKSYNYDKAQSIANEVAELRACIARNQVYAKSHASYASAAKSLNSLQKKANYLSENKEKIAKYYEILKPDLLKELYDISKTVDANF